MENIAEGYDHLMTDFEQRRRNQGFPFARSELSDSSAGEFGSIHDNQYKIMKEVIQSLQTMREYMQIMLIGQNLRQYHRFKRLIPGYGKTSAGQFLFEYSLDIDKRTPEQARDCLNFVIDTAKRIQQFDNDEG